MSLLGFQSGIAALIRSPKANRPPDLEKFLRQFALTEDETRQLKQLARHRELNKYGGEQAHQRWETLRRHIVRLFRFVDEGILEDLWFYDFEPRAIFQEVDVEGRYAFSLAFLAFLLKDRGARKILKEAVGSWIFDLIKFEKAEIELFRPVPDDPPLAPGSKLSHAHFRVVDLAHQIPKMLAGPLEAAALPERAQLTLLFVRIESFANPRIFVIDAAMKDFLLSQLSAPERPSAAQRRDLKAMGLLSQSG